MYGSRSYGSQDDKAFWNGPQGTGSPERIAPRQLPEKQMQEMVIAVQVLGVPITFVPLYYLIELVTWNKLHDLGKHKLALIHNPDAFGGQQD